jgi:hypothetical protein
MFWANRTDKVAGTLLLLLAVLSIAGFVAGTPLGEVDPFARTDVEQMLRTIHDHFGLWVSSLVPFVVQDVLIVATAALLYIAFRDRSRALALVAAFASLGGSVALMLHEVGAMTLAFLSADAVGQAGTVVADPMILATARAVAVGQALSALVGQTLLGVGVLCIGTLIAWAPEGRANPPRWLGFLGLMAGLGMIATWSFLTNHLVGGGVTLLAETGLVVMFAVLGVWFLRRPDELRTLEVETMAAQQGGT